MREFDLEDMDTITITFEDGEESEFYVLESTTLNETNYYLVMPAEDEDEEDDDELECYILKESNLPEDEEYGIYSFVEDEDELDGLSRIFDELLDEE